MGCMPKIGKRANEQAGCFNMVKSLFDVYLDRPFHILYFYMLAMEIWIVKRRSTEQNIDEIQRKQKHPRSTWSSIHGHCFCMSTILRSLSVFGHKV